MANARLESSSKLKSLSFEIGEVCSDMDKSVRELNGAFRTATETWKDKNAKVCSQALIAHNEQLRIALEKLKDLESFASLLGRYAEEYEDI